MTLSPGLRRILPALVIFGIIPLVVACVPGANGLSCRARQLAIAATDPAPMRATTPSKSTTMPAPRPRRAARDPRDK